MAQSVTRQNSGEYGKWWISYETHRCVHSGYGCQTNAKVSKLAER